MKSLKIKKIRDSITSMLLFAVVVSFIMPGSALVIFKQNSQQNAAPTLSGNNLTITNITATAGQQNVVVDFLGSWDQPLGGFTSGFYFDKTKVEIVEIDFSQSGLPAAWMKSNTVYDTQNPAYMQIGGIDAMGRNPSPACTNRLIARIKFNVLSTASNGQMLFDLSSMTFPNTQINHCIFSVKPSS